MDTILSERLIFKLFRADTATCNVTTPAIAISLDIIKHRYPHYFPAGKTFSVDKFHYCWVRSDIERHYGKPLHQVVGVVTPFSAQVEAIKNALESHDVNCGGGEDSLTVGTVHSLQGAERAIVIFSSVYSKHEDGGFIDRKASMLNVAVSRAKDSFLVFGDMDLFEIQPGSTPQGLLAKYLFASESNILHFEFKARKDLSQAQTQISTLHGVEQHDAFLNQTFDDIGKNITIVSPWLTWQKLEQTGFLASMVQARS